MSSLSYQSSGLFILLLFVFSVYSKDQIDVLKISNVEFPMSKYIPATFDATFVKEIPEFTICIRFLIESYNNNLFYLAQAGNKEQVYFMDRIGWETGMERDGFQAGVSLLQRNIPEGGLGEKEFPWFHHYNIPKNIATSKEWNQNKIKLQITSVSELMKL